MVQKLFGKSNQKLTSQNHEALTSNCKFHIEHLLDIKTGAIITGWCIDHLKRKPELIIKPTVGSTVKCKLNHNQKGVITHPAFRPDLKLAVSEHEFGRGMHGFICYVPLRLESQGTITISLSCDNKLQEIVPHGLDSAEAVKLMNNQWLHAGEPLKRIASTIDHQELIDFLDDIETIRIGGSSDIIANCNHALLLNAHTLILNGYITKPSHELESVSIKAGGKVFDVTQQITRYIRPDLFGTIPWSNTSPLGYILTLTNKDEPVREVRIKVVTANGQKQIIQPEVGLVDWSVFGGILKNNPLISEPLINALSESDALPKIEPNFDDRIKWLRSNLFNAQHASLPQFVESPDTIIGAVDRGFPLGDAGLLFFGWQINPFIKPKAITLRNADGDSVDVATLQFNIIREDVYQTYHSKYPNISEDCGYFCLAPMPTRGGEPRSITYDFGELGSTTLKVPTDKSATNGQELIKEIFNMFHAPDRMMNQLYKLFNHGLGQAIEIISKNNEQPELVLSEKQFGEPVEGPTYSVIIPLYGRYDFIRHQLAQFADDPDFGQTDLIYVVDDPEILGPTLQLAARYQQLFGIPFRVVWYGVNLGFAGANNMGVKAARSDQLVLLNSDVIPQHTGWLTTLSQALENLPDAGAVGPLLQFGDGSIQHAGMYPRTEQQLPGFLLNTHRKMGMAWDGDTKPSEHPMLTAACLMMRTEDYRDLGGFDEGYVIGDFEDSDLCLALRNRGKRLWLTPEARLWHLERQSQNLDAVASQRQLLTLYNGWRYHEKINTGKLANPSQIEI